ncbi:MAG TPA: DUF4403 family protein [Nitrospira sp.]|nr:DUF4403 family protein [Nitrospira sp.]
MSSKSGYGVLVILSVVLLSGCSVFSENVVRPPEPEPLQVGRPPVAPLAKSMISVPISLDLSAMLHHANDESVIPKKFDHWGSHIKSPKGMDYKYYAEREEFAINPSGAAYGNSAESERSLRDWWKGMTPTGSSVAVSAGVRYKAEVQPSVHTAGLPVHCGEGSEWPRRATLNGSIALGIAPNYNVSASVVGVAMNTIDPCLIRPADVDPTQEVKYRVADSVRLGLTRAVAPINTLTVKSQVEHVWNALRAPIKLDQDMWLQLNPDMVGQSGVLKGGPVVEGEIQVGANPVVILGSEPAAAGATLPPLDPQPVAPGFRVAADVQLDYVSLSQALATRLKGKLFQVKGDVVRITNATISGHGGNQILLRIDFNGDAYGHVYMIGKPGMNVLTQSVFIGDLYWDSATEKRLLEVASWLHSASFRALVAEQAVFGVTPETDRIKGLLTSALNRPLSPTVSMHGTVASVQGINVFADVNALHVQTMSEGTLSVTVGGKP